MSDIIKLLPDSVANQIAAGEVIQRPASAVKELLENAIDAGANDISLIIKNAGKTLVQVTDNGSGMSAIDARMSFERHATSKISKADDLFAIRTMGFRGEALASIAAIAQVELKTKPHEDELGTCLKIDGSKLISQESCQCKPGTNILIKNLFFNIPARRNFLKSNNAETRHILEEFIRVSVINPKISFGFIHDNKIVFKLISGSLKSRIVGIFGNNYNERLLSVEQKTDKLTINGFIGKPEYAKKTRGEQYFFVNRRFIKHAYLNHAVANAFTELIPVDAFPSYFLNIDIDPKEIDINIHPTKTEVNFKDARYVYAVIHAAVKQAIGKHSLTPTIDFNVNPEIESALSQKPDKTLRQPGVKVDPEYNPFKDSSEKGNQAFVPKRDSGDKNWEKIFESQREGKKQQITKTTVESDQISFKKEEEGTKQFFQFNNRFVLCNVKSGLMVIDQKKAYERILYEQYLQQLSGSTRPSQQQLFPHNINLSPGDAEIIKSLKSDLSKLGFTIENLGANGFVINGIPADLIESDIEKVLERMIENHKKEAQSLDYDKNATLARSMAGSTALKEGRKLSEKEMEDIFNRLFACNAPEVSPDGKSIISIISPTDFEKLMKK